MLIILFSFKELDASSRVWVAASEAASEGASAVVVDGAEWRSPRTAGHELSGADRAETSAACSRAISSAEASLLGARMFGAVCMGE